MKILFLSDLLAYGGASKLIFDLMQRMVLKGNICELLILSDQHMKYAEELREKNITVNVFPKKIKGHLRKIKYLKEYIKNGDYDIVHANLFPITYYCSIVKKILGKKCPPIIMTEHSTDNKRRHKKVLRPVEKWIYKEYDHVISISSKTKENLCSWLKTKDDRFSVIENGISIDVFKEEKSVPPQELYPDYREENILLLMVGSFTPQKNHSTIIDALALLPKQYILLLCGEGPLQAVIKQKVENLGIMDRVVFLGFRKEVAPIMHTADILVIPSIWEGFGLIAAEGMACGIPIVASDVPGLSEIVGQAGIKFNPVNTNEMVSAILEMSDKKKAEKYIQHGKEIVNNYDIDMTTRMYLNVYEMVKNNRKGRNEKTTA